MADLEERVGSFLGLQSVKWGSKDRPDGTVRTAGNMLIMHFLPDPVGRLFAPPLEINVPDELIQEAQSYSRLDPVRIAIESYAKGNSISRSLKDIASNVTAVAAAGSSKAA